MILFLVFFFQFDQYFISNLPKQKQQQKKQQQKHPQQQPVRQNASNIPHLAAGVCIFINIATFSVPIWSAKSSPIEP